MRTRTADVSAVTLLGALLLCACRTAPPARAIDPDPGTEKAVYEALIREAYVSGDTKMIVLDPRYVSGGDEWNWGQRPAGVPADAWQALLVAFRREGGLPSDVDPGLPVAWLDDDQFGALPAGASIEGRWTAFHDRFPGSSGHVQLSRIGFSRDARTAVVYGFVGSGSLSASGDLFVLRKTSAGWRLVKTHNYVVA